MITLPDRFINSATSIDMAVRAAEGGNSNYLHEIMFGILGGTVGIVLTKVIFEVYSDEDVEYSQNDIRGQNIAVLVAGALTGLASGLVAIIIKN